MQLFPHAYDRLTYLCYGVIIHNMNRFYVLLLADPFTKKDESCVTRSFYQFQNKNLTFSGVYIISDRQAFEVGHSYPNTTEDLRSSRLTEHGIREVKVVNNVDKFIKSVGEDLLVISSNMPKILKASVSEICGKHGTVKRFSSGTPLYRDEHRRLMEMTY